MTTDLISNVNSPPRAPLPEAAAIATRQPAVVSSKAAEPVKPPQAAEKTPDKLEVKQAVEKIAEFVSSRQSELSFSIDDTSGSQIVKITDIQTKQVIRQFPSEEAVAIARALDKLQGLLIRDKA
ncbi:flagellar protein FlaG [Dechloromonas sp. HYN0024]|uniref:flagellar protein FlaG n=1 Tax=Dechloromonas sp. HYN0024 TaxID=2231055 RepID=UPI000E446F2B|nr:flagellar protein FlaG [Dechloromonas sp. HYN0024]AXS79200.1 hypothetical protein HYN24_03600 [Dechloromonas sp. HYN0024]